MDAPNENFFDILDHICENCDKWYGIDVADDWSICPRCHHITIHKNPEKHSLEQLYDMFNKDNICG